jgi:Cu+-exporting ATPase
MQPSNSTAASAPGSERAVASTGGPVTELLVSGMTCQNCARHVAEAIQCVPGVRSASVQLDAGRASVRWAPDARADVSALLHAVRAAGYEATPVEAGAADAAARRSGWQWNLLLGGAVTLTLAAGEWLLGWGMERWFQWLAFALAGVVQVFCGARFYRGAWRQLRVGSSNMDTLVALGSTTAFGYSAWVLLNDLGGHVYFMEAAAIITLISTGHWLEARMSERAAGALRALMTLAPPTARRLTLTGAGTRGAMPTWSEQAVPVAALNAGDLVVLRPGDRVPTDGVVVEGHSAVDEAMLTGESVPVDKSPGSELYAGTVNLNGRLVMRVTATGEATALAHVIAAVQRAQSSRAHIQRLGDRVASVFVPVVVLVAIAAGLWWGLAPDSAQEVHARLARYLWPIYLPTGSGTAFIVAAAVLIIACPCAMGLATPAAIMAAANVAARRGILIRDGVALEKAGHITAVVFDKTGTLTSGRAEVAAVWTATHGTSSPDARALAASLARHSTHPVSRALATASADEVALAQWAEVRGAGVEGRLRQGEGIGRVARLGSLRWLEEAGVSLAPGEAFVREWSAQGATIVGVAVDGALLGLFAVRDALKPGAAAVMAQLERRGLKCFLVTGDHPLTAASVAKQAGIAAGRVRAGVRPEAKAAFVKELQQSGERVAFVGDGINDAPALEQADLGIAVSRASDVAREAADIILLKSEIEAVPEALGLARATLRTIRQNLFWAFFYNVLGVPLAALGFMTPVLCALAMGCSDLVVIGNALRLQRWKPEPAQAR